MRTNAEIVRASICDAVKRREAFRESNISTCIAQSYLPVGMYECAEEGETGPECP
jgi:hypothetical protein